MAFNESELLRTMLTEVGDTWTADDDCTFPGVLDHSNSLTDTDNGTLFTSLITLTVRTCDVKDIAEYRYITGPDDTVYQVRQKVRQDDGAMSLLTLVEKKGQ